MILDPDDRSLYTDALRAPTGYTFDQAIATTFTLDLTTLLTIPLHLTLFARGEDTEALLDDGVGLLEALRRTSNRIRVYCQRGQISVPARKNPLFSLLEPVVRETRVSRGLFHPKLWVLRFVAESSETPLLRLLVLSRNLSQARSWDMILRLDGEPAGRRRQANGPLARLIEELPRLTVQGGGRSEGQRCRRLADEVARTVWELPEPFREVRFHVPGLESRAWRPPDSGSLLVISPFVSDRGLETLASTTGRAVALVSRPEELARLAPGTLTRFERVFHLSQAAESEDPEKSANILEEPLKGLHAKAYVCRTGTDTRVFVGSSNATSQGIDGSNVELLAELVGKQSKVGRVKSLLEDSGLMAVLEEYVPGSVEDRSPEEKEAEKALLAAQKALMRSRLGVRCEEAPGGWRMILEGKIPRLSGLALAEMWPITLPKERAVSVNEGLSEPAVFDSSLQAITSFFAIRLKAEAFDLELRFALNLPIEGVPEERYGAIMKGVLQNRERFIRYLLLLLATGEEEWLIGAAGEGDGTRWASGSWDDVPLLEEMVRALCREPDRLWTLAPIVQRLSADPETGDILPEGFQELWGILQAELEDLPK